MIDISALDAAIQRPQPPMKRSTKSGSSAGARSASRRDSFTRNDDSSDPSNVTHTDPRHKTSTTRTTQPSLRPRSSTSSSTLTKPTIKRRPGHARDLRSRSHPLQALAQALASPSVASLLSTLTTQTSSSSGSNSTIKPDPPRQRLATGGVPSASRDHHRDPLPATRQPLEYSRPAEQTVDVFQYLQTESAADTAASPPLPASHQHQPSASDPDSVSDSDSDSFSGESSAETAPSSRSRSSSVHSSSTTDPPLRPGSHSRILATHARPKASEWLHLQPESSQAASERNSSLHTGNHNFVAQRGEGVDGTDNASLRPITFAPMGGEDRASQTRVRSSPSQIATPLPSTLAMAWLSDTSRDLLNCQLMPAYHRFLSIFCREGTVTDESRPIPRPYRRFENLNHRILACLQDELAVLENRLAILDGLIATCGLQDAAAQPDFQRRVGNLHFQRTEMIANTHVKINQYNQALASYNALLRDTVPASADSIQQHASRRMQASTTTAAHLAQHTGDLVNLSNARPTSGGDDTAIQALIIVPPIALTATWLTFACISGVFTGVLAFFGIMATAHLMFNLDLRLCRRFDKRLFLGAGMLYAVLLIYLAITHL